MIIVENGLRIYLARHSYGNATTVDLWNAHSEASGQVRREEGRD